MYKSIYKPKYHEKCRSAYPHVILFMVLWLKIQGYVSLQRRNVSAYGTIFSGTKTRIKISLIALLIIHSEVISVGFF